MYLSIWQTRVLAPRQCLLIKFPTDCSYVCISLNCSMYLLNSLRICPSDKHWILHGKSLSSSNSHLIGQQIPSNVALTFITCQSHPFKPANVMAVMKLSKVRKMLKVTWTIIITPPQIPNWLDIRYRAMLPSHWSDASVRLFCNMPICLRICPATTGKIQPTLYKQQLYDIIRRNRAALGLGMGTPRPWLAAPQRITARKWLAGAGRNEACIGFYPVWMRVASGWDASFSGCTVERIQILMQIQTQIQGAQWREYLLLNMSLYL